MLLSRHVELTRLPFSSFLHASNCMTDARKQIAGRTAYAISKLIHWNKRSSTPFWGQAHLNQIYGLKLDPGDANTEFFEGRNG